MARRRKTFTHHHSPVRSLRHLAAALTAVAVAAISGGVLAAGATAATPSTATIQVATAVPGVTLGLFTAQSGSAQLDAEWATATSETSGDEHVATFTVPITGSSTGITPDGVASNLRLWVAGVTAPAGYSLPTALGTGPLTATTNDPHKLRTYSFQTPTLQAGGTYRSGTGTFMNRSTASGTSSYEGSTGHWTAVRDNPAMRTSCSGLNVAVVLDFSASVSDAQVDEVKGVASAYVDALAGTPSSMQVFPFGTKALRTSDLYALTTQANVDALKTNINGFTRPGDRQYTNWDDALREIPTGAFDVIVMVTDGMPTVYGDDGSHLDGSGATRFAEMEAAITAANTHKAATTLKGTGTHIKAFGVGNGINSAAALANLEAIASPDAVTRTQDYAEVAAKLRAQVLADCTPSVSVTKLVEPWNYGAAGVERAPAAGWDLTAHVEGMTLGDGDATQTTPDGGGVMWRFVAADPNDRATVTVTETQQPGYKLVPQGGQNAACVVKNASTPVDGKSIEATNTNNGFTLKGIAGGDMVTCTIINKEPPPPEVGTVTVAGSAHVDYDWAISKDVTTDRVVQTTPGTDVEFGYSLFVTATRQDGPVTVTGSATVTNPSSIDIPIGDVTASVGGVLAKITGPTSIAPGKTAELIFTAELAEVSSASVPVTVTVPGRAPVVTSLASSDIAPTQSDRSAVVTDTFPEFASAHPDLTALDAEQVIAAGGVTFGYTAERGADTPADGGSAQFVNVASVRPSGPDPLNPPADGWEDDQDPGDLTDDETVTVRTPPEYDLALRMWVAEVWHGDVQLFERNSDPSDAGPENRIPHATFDRDDFDIQVGDLIVYDVHVFNQGDRTARVDELVSYRATGLELAGADLLAGVVHHDNTGWGDAPDGSGHLLMPDAGIVLAPGDSAEVTLTLVVTQEAMSEDGEAADRFAFAEIAAFSGWVPVLEPAPLRALALPAMLAPASYDGVNGSWSADVIDVDSRPDRDNGGTDVDDTTLVYHSWEDNEIHESNTSMLWDSDDDDFDNDEDDHDGSIIRVFAAGYRESLETSDGGDTGTGDTDDVPTDDGDAGTEPDDTEESGSGAGTTPDGVEDADDADPGTITVAAGGETSGLGAGTRAALLAGAAALLTVGGVLLARRARESTGD